MELPNWISLARQIATTVDRDRVHISFIIRKKNTLLAIGTNNFKTHPKTVEYGYMLPYLHSELDAFRKLKGSRDKLTLINLRFSKTGQLGMAKPCIYCMPWCTTVFDSIIYSNHKGSIDATQRNQNWKQSMGSQGNS